MVPQQTSHAAARSCALAYGGQTCNPYATDRDSGSSSTGSAAGPSANLAVCGISEESLGSIREPGKKCGLVAIAPTRGLVSRHGSWPANLLRERFAPVCRHVEDVARVLDAVRGFDANEGRYGLDIMLARRGDARVKSVLDLSIDFDDLDGDGDSSEHISFVRIDEDPAASIVQRNRPGVTPGIGVPATKSGLTMDTQGQSAHVFRQMAIREIVAHPG